MVLWLNKFFVHLLRFGVSSILWSIEPIQPCTVELHQISCLLLSNFPHELVEDYMVAKCWNVQSLSDSKEELVQQAGLTTRSGRKWAANAAVEQAVSSMKLWDIISNPCIHREGLGSAHKSQAGHDACGGLGLGGGKVNSQASRKRFLGSLDKMGLAQAKKSLGQSWRPGADRQWVNHHCQPTNWRVL